MDSKELIEIIELGEDSKVQFKRMFTSPDSMAAEIGAFANSAGGKILVGVNDDGRIIGLSKGDITKLNQMISNVCSQKIEPTISVITENIRYEDKVVMVINVPIGPNKFHMVNGTDIWVKVGADKRRARREELKRLLQESSNIYADEQVLQNTDLKDLDMDILLEFLENKVGQRYIADKDNINRILNNMKILKGENCTLGGLLLFGKKASLKSSQFYTAAVSWYGTSIAGVEYRESEDIYGNVIRQYKDGMAFIKRQLRKLQKDQDFNTLGILEIPEEALQEALVNAIIHRNYFINSNIRIFNLDDRVEITSPGSLPNTLDVDSIRYGLRAARNPILLSYIKDLPDMPYRGIESGIPRIIESCSKAGIKVDFINKTESGGQFKVVFWKED